MKHTGRIAWTSAVALTLVLIESGNVGAQAASPPQTPPHTSDTPQASPPRKGDPKDLPTKLEGTPAVVVDDTEVESLLGKDIKSATGEKLGQITDVIAGKSGDIRAAIIDFGGFLGVGTRKIAIAWSALRFTPEAIVVDMTRDELRVSPEYRHGEPIVVVGATSSSPPGKAAASSNAPPQQKPSQAPGK
ncbi:PRC-barrel domain-containing protein [Hyphomicrobium methylovorum]|uniref:PRC-barrel domain-containing protein n=1 Tax=Hyphomicrobium methylovorum TaxID=84 RepID=UPI0015E7BBDD|nr:PRC-barrel domain-containing protein [Hyphomicrobium methylovorum]